MIGPGARVGARQILARLGGGGQGEVFLACPWAEGAARRAATRLLLRAVPLSPRAAARWQLAALKLANQGMADSLHDEHSCLAAPGAGHAHLARLYRSRFPGSPAPDLGFTNWPAGPGPRLYLALAYEAGVPLSLLLARWGAWRPAPRWSLAVATQVTRALAHLHGRGVVHHDVRPTNLIVRPGPHAVLIDLGAAEAPGAPRRRAVYGSAGWLSPERLGAEPAPASPLVDIYGVGALLRALVPAPPPALARLIEEALAPDPARRGAALPSAEALLARLEDSA